MMREMSQGETGFGGEAGSMVEAAHQRGRHRNGVGPQREAADSIGIQAGVPFFSFFTLSDFLAHDREIRST